MTRKEALEYVNNMYMYEDTKNALETLIPEFGKAGSDTVIDYEEKYKEALEVMRQWIAPCHTKEQLDTLKKSVFPELAESEDERIISNNIEELNLLKEIQNYYKKNLAGLYITFAMYKRIARYFYSLGKKQK